MTQPPESTLPPVRWMRVQEVAAYLDVNHSTVRRAIRSGELPATKIGRSLRVKEDDVKALIGTKAAP